VDALQAVLGYAVTHPWKTLLFLVLAVWSVGAPWPQLLAALVIAAFVAVFDT
jgi:hypothetical protein